jgi:hypothetical protein
MLKQLVFAGVCVLIAGNTGAAVVESAPGEGCVNYGVGSALRS